MKKEIKEKWLEALRSGEYKQAHARLKTGQTFCCLGVLCDLHRKEKPEKRFWDETDESYLGDLHTLPTKVANWAGFKGKYKRNPLIKVTVGDTTRTEPMADFNDGFVEPWWLALSFKELADLIEEQF